MKEKEHQSIECKESWQDEYLKWICGYANAYGGTIYIGTDDDGNVVGIDNARDLLERKYLTPMLKNGVLKMTIPEKPSSKNQKYFS